VAVVNIFMFDASGNCRSAALAQRTWPLSASATIRPLAAPPPCCSHPRIWSQARLA